MTRTNPFTNPAMDVTTNEFTPDGGVPLKVTTARVPQLGLELQSFEPEGQPRHATVWAHVKGQPRIQLIPATATSPETLCVMWDSDSGVHGAVYLSGLTADMLRAELAPQDARRARQLELADLLHEALSNHTDDTSDMDECDCWLLALERYQEARFG